MLILIVGSIALISFGLATAFMFFKFFEVLLPLIFWGAIFVPTEEKRIEKMIDFLAVKPGEKAVDLGAGDGRLVIALAEAGAEAHGYEINPFLVSLARKNIKKAGLGGKAFICRKNFWNENLSEFDVVTVYGIPHIMKRLETKLRQELKQNARVCSNAFKFPTWKPVKQSEGVYLYIKRE